MIAYNKTAFQNLEVLNEAEEVQEEGLITNEEYIKIKEAYPLIFYTPNLLIRVGIYILTWVIMLFSFGILALLFLNISQNAEAVIGFAFAALSFTALEFLISTKNHFRSGVDDALIHGTLVALCAGFSLAFHSGETANYFLVFIIASLFMFRFADSLMAILSFLALCAFIYSCCRFIGGQAKIFATILVMIISLATYITVSRIAKADSSGVYKLCLLMLKIAALVIFYMAGNYWVINDLIPDFFSIRFNTRLSLPFSIFFWICNFIIPILYILWGIKKKDLLILRIGLLLTAAAVFTFRYYHALLRVEFALLAAGVIMISIAYVLIRYLKINRNGFTDKDLRSARRNDRLNIESLVISETISPVPPGHGGTSFGGGSFGGGGASGNY